jgi:hypothetical protein
MYNLEVGTIVTLSTSTRKNGTFAGEQGIVVAKGDYSGYFLSIRGKIINFHPAQIEFAEGINESR